MSRNSTSALMFIVNLVLAAFSHHAAAAGVTEQAKILAPYVNNDTFAAAYINLGAANVVQLSGDLLKYLPANAEVAGPWMAGTAVADGFVRQFQQAGGAGAYLVAGLSDVRQSGGPLAIVTAKPGQSIDKVEKLVQDLLRQFDVRDVAAQRQGDVVIIGSKLNVERYAKLQSAERADLVEPLGKLADEKTLLAAVFCPGPDFRRVVRELWPQLPGVLAEMKGELADRWLRVELAINQSPEAQPRLALVASDAASAEQFAKLWREIPTATTQFDGNQASKELAKSYAQLLVDSVPAKVDGTTVTLRIPTDENQLAKLKTMFSEAADKSMESSRRAQRANQFKQLLLGMLNYYDVNKRLPPAAICDADGKPLLSWRVAILPYLDEDGLYKQFHLDEPWDSQHNRLLLQKMPALFADPDPKLNQLTQTGKTTYQVPVNERTAFHGREGSSFREMADGTSNTILLVEVSPSHAVEWSKPGDWQVDLDHPREGLQRDGRTHVTFGFADGHVQIDDLQNAADKTLRAYLTSAGGETIDRP